MTARDPDMQPSPSHTMPAPLEGVDLTSLRHISDDPEVTRLRKRLLHHPVYGAIRDVTGLRRFAEHHVFAVWDFMCIVKALQQDLTCVTVPWAPPPDPMAARLINEIVLGEESDEAPGGGYTSHFDLYRLAMRELGADTGPVDRFIDALQHGCPVEEALRSPGVPEASRRFARATLDGLAGPLHVRAALLLMGREALIPDMFRSIVAQLGEQAGQQAFLYYLDRHIEIDGGSHSQLASSLLARLCEGRQDRLEDCRRATVSTLRARDALWNAILAQIGA